MVHESGLARTRPTPRPHAPSSNPRPRERIRPGGPGRPPLPETPARRGDPAPPAGPVDRTLPGGLAGLPAGCSLRARYTAEAGDLLPELEYACASHGCARQTQSRQGIANGMQSDTRAWGQGIHATQEEHSPCWGPAAVRPMSDPPGRQVRVEGTFVPPHPLSRGVARSGRTSRSRQPVARGAGRGWGYGVAGDVSRDGLALCGGTAGAAWVRQRAGLGAGPGHAHVGGRDVPALWQQAGAGPGGARVHREDALLSGGGRVPVEPRQAGRGLRPGVPRLLVGAGLVGAGAAGLLQLHLPSLARARVWAALAAGSRASGGRGAHSPAVVRWDDAGAGARGAGEGRAGGRAATRLRPTGRGAGVGHADGTGSHGAAGRAGE